MALSYALMPVPRQVFVDTDGHAYAGGTLTFFETGTLTPKAIFSTPQGTVSLGTSLELDASGVAPGIYLEYGAYDVQLADSDGTVIRTTAGVSDTGGTYFARIGAEWTTGPTVTSAYTPVDADRFVQVNGAAPITITLPSADARLTPLAIKNIGTSTVSIDPPGSETLEGSGTAWVLPAGDEDLRPSVWLLPDGVSAWWIVASNGCAATSVMIFPSESMSPSHSPSGSRSASGTLSISPSASPSEPATGSESSSPSSSPSAESRVIEVFIWDSTGPVVGATVYAYKGTPAYDVSGVTDVNGLVTFSDIPADITSIRLTVTHASYSTWRYLFVPGLADGPPWTYNGGFGGYYGAAMMPGSYAYAAVLGAEVLPYVPASLPLKAIAPYYERET
jgi:hypothetical protein